MLAAGVAGAKRAGRRGFSLMEVVLALAILTAAVAVLGELVRSGLHNARLARDLSKAELLCEGTVYQIESGLLPAQAVHGAPIEEAPGWYYSVEQVSGGMGNQGGGTGNQSGLWQLRVTVERNPEERRPTRYSIVRWMRDPSLVLAQQAQQMSILPTSSPTGTTTGTGGSSSTGSGTF